MRPVHTTLSLVLLLLLNVAPASAEEDEAIRRELGALVAAESYLRALEVADVAIAEDGECVGAWQYRAYALHRLGRLEEAKSAYEKTVSLDPGNWWAFMNLGDLHSALGNYAEAVQAGKRAALLNPAESTVHRKLSRIHREQSDYVSAVASVRRALATGADPAWCHAELGYLYWAAGETVRSRSHWGLARASGTDEAACGHGLRLLDWDRTSGSSKKQEEIGNRRRGVGEGWVFPVGEIEVRTRVGPKLPRDLERLLTDIEKGHSKVIGFEGEWTAKVRLFLSRTIEEHEIHRVREFPAGYSEKAFCVQRQFGGRGRFGGRGGGRFRRQWDLDVYVAYSAVGLERSLSHELTHALLAMRMPRTTNLSVWLDEGLATYLEYAPDKRDRLASGTVRADLLATIGEANILSWPMMSAAGRADFVGPNARARYAQAWSMVHFLIEGARGGDRRFRRVLDEIDSTRRPMAGPAIRQIYEMDDEALEAAWKKHIAKIRGD